MPVPVAKPRAVWSPAVLNSRSALELMHELGAGRVLREDAVTGGGVQLGDRLVDRVRLAMAAEVLAVPLT